MAVTLASFTKITIASFSSKTYLLATVLAEHILTCDQIFVFSQRYTRYIRRLVVFEVVRNKVLFQLLTKC